jgi:hypothetical protein
VPKIRGFKSDLWTNEDFVELSPYARLLWMGMWNYACDNGHLADKSKQIKMRVLPTDDVNCAELLRELEEYNRIVREDGVITIPNFTKHQKPDRRYFQTCDVPGCDKPVGDSQRESRGGHGEHTTSAPRGSQGPHDEVKGSEVKGSDGEGRAAGKPAKRATSLPDDFRPTEKHQELAAGLGVDLKAEWSKFCDHHRAKGSTFKDWGAALNNWIRRAAEYGGSNVRPLQRTPIDDQGRLILPPLPPRNPWDAS